MCSSQAYLSNFWCCGGEASFMFLVKSLLPHPIIKSFIYFWQCLRWVSISFISSIIFFFWAPLQLVLIFSSSSLYVWKHLFIDVVIFLNKPGVLWFRYLGSSVFRFRNFPSRSYLDSQWESLWHSYLERWIFLAVFLKLWFSNYSWIE